MGEIMVDPEAADAHGTTKLRDIEFAPGLLLDLTLPVGSDSSVPLVMWLHGGAWRIGDRTLIADDDDMLPRAGIATASIDYRLSGEASFPAPLDDARTALRWLRDHAAEFGIDPSRVGVWGSSAGAHLASLLALTAPTSESIAAVVHGYGPADLLAPDQDNPATEALLGGSLDQRQDLAREASPAHRVGESAPPFLLLHGASDPLVPATQSEALYNALASRGHEATLYLIDGFGHGFLNVPGESELGPGPVLDAGHLRSEPDALAVVRTTVTDYSPSPSASYDTILDFFSRHLGR